MSIEWEADNWTEESKIKALQAIIEVLIAKLEGYGHRFENEEYWNRLVDQYYPKEPPSKSRAIEEIIETSMQPILARNKELESRAYDNWQTIDTAPKDGTPILGYYDGEVATVQWLWDDWHLIVCGAYADNGLWSPTHWVALPPAPEI